jgi:hypothetical protein
MAVETGEGTTYSPSTTSRRISIIVRITGWR